MLSSTRVFCEGMYEVLLLSHLIATFALIGAASHNLWCVLRYVRGRFVRQATELRFMKLAMVSYVFVYFFGVFIYPAFRVYIRGEYFDEFLHWAPGLFEVKEHWAAIGLALFVVVYLLRRSFEPEREREKLFLYVPLCVIVNVIAWYTTLAGAYLTLVKGTLQ